ncbi:MAG: sodium-dependent transporter [Cyclobacteriaceae bacterium]|nr:sodium-dependent transporter [Cyclobacteriaceae bacterium HetDA_MAG_MS6]
MSKTEQFSSRWGIVLASLGMAIGAGNLWRFPRLAGQYGGAFIILWIVFLFVWSIPLLLSEFAIGKQFRNGVIGSYARFAGKKYTFLGFFITICTLGIAFYYAVVTSWALRYLGFSFGNLFDTISGGPTLREKLSVDANWLDGFWAVISNGNWVTIVIFILVVVTGIVLLARGIERGLERANKVLIPSLFVLLFLIVLVVLNMENGLRGLEYMFAVDFDHFSNPKIWIEALSQSAWSTGAGWGLMMTLSSYSRSGEDVTLNTFIGAFGNNTASLLSGMAILPAVFALSASDQAAISYLQSGNQALTFTIIPKLFSELPAGEFLAVVFFLALFVAAFSSFLPMIELLQRNILDLGITRRQSIVFVLLLFVLFGFPSAYSLDYFTNQDWVWGLGLILTGLFILFAVALHGPIAFKKAFIDGDSDIRISNVYFSVFVYINLLIGVVLIYWWMSQGYSSYPWFDENGRWHLLDVYSNASIVTQWGLVLIVGLSINAFLYKKFAKQ